MTIRSGVLAINGADVVLNVRCSKGTYVRTLCADIGETLGVGGHLLALERRRVGTLSIEQALTVDQIADLTSIGTLADRLIPLDRVLDRLPAVTVTGEQARRVLHGAPIESAETAVGSASATVRLTDESGRLLAIGLRDPRAAGWIKIQKVLTSCESLN